MTIISCGPASINEDRYKFPDPDLIIQSVTRKEDLGKLGQQNMHAGNGYVYFYIDRGWRTNRVNYVGETRNGLQSRHNATHSRSGWFKDITYPLIGVCQSPYRQWDTDTRRIIEALVIHRMHAIGFTPANHENGTWTNGVDLSDHPDAAYLEGVVKKIVEYQLFHVGIDANETIPKLLGEGKEKPVSAVSKDEDEPDVSVAEVKTIDTSAKPSKKDFSPKGIWKDPVEGRRIIARRGLCVVKGYQTADRKAVITEVKNMASKVASYVPENTKKRRLEMVAEAKLNEHGLYDWEGETEPNRPTYYLTIFFGNASSNVWEEDI